MAVRHSFSAEELAQLPDSGRRFELIDGELITMSPANPDHSSIGVEIVRLIGNYVIERRLGEVFGADAGFRLSQFPDTVLAPDASFVSSKRLPPKSEWGKFFQFAPDLAFEVLSLSNTAREMANKTRRYFEAGSVLVIIVDPRTRTVDVNELDTPTVHLAFGDTLDLTAVIQGLQIPVSAIFRSIIETP